MAAGTQAAHQPNKAALLIRSDVPDIDTPDDTAIHVIQGKQKVAVGRYSLSSGGTLDIAPAR